MKGKRVILKGQIIVFRDSIIREVERIDKEA
jgi:tartrate dehydratase beta subunit/fumarate hydratase class I family protein